MPNRILKDSICTSDSIASLSDFHEAFFYRLIVNCDDYGRMDARPAILKARLYPLRERLTLKDVQSALRALADAGCVEVYEVDGKPYLRLPSWEVHQQIRAKKSKYPAPDNTCNQLISDDSKCPRNPIQSESEYKTPKPPEGADDLFDQFWDIYPKKVGEADARKAWKKLSPDAELFSLMKKALSWQKQLPGWLKDNGQFIPYPATWLRGRRWEDQPDNGTTEVPRSAKRGRLVVNEDGEEIVVFDDD